MFIIQSGKPSGDENVVLLFDGLCNLCNSTVRFIIKRDRQEKVKFAPLQSETAKKLLSDAKQHRHLRQGPAELTALTAGKTVVLIEDGKVYTASTAVLRVLRYLSPPWPLLAVLRFAPQALRDGVYDVVARNRYRWFGKSDECLIPTDAMRRRFLE